MIGVAVQASVWSMRWATKVAFLITFGFAAALAFLSSQAVASDKISAEHLREAVPGTVFRVWPLEGGARPGYKAYRILYRSTDMNDVPVAVTGAILFPEEPTTQERNVVAWAHPTTGVNAKCGASFMPTFSGMIQGMEHFMAKGYVVVATDYPGLGSPGHHPYLVGTSAARAVLDAVRATRFMRDASAGRRFVVWGHSQGGHAALFTGAEAYSYSPDLELLGVAAAAPATKLVDHFKGVHDTSSGRMLTAMTLQSWSQVFGLQLQRYVHASSEPAFERLANDCIETVSDLIKEDHDERALPRNYLKLNPTEDLDARTLMVKNSAGPLPVGTPVFLAQATGDTLILPDVTFSYARELCAASAKVKIHLIDGSSHMFTARDSAYAAAQWIDSRFSGQEPSDDC